MSFWQFALKNVKRNSRIYCTYYLSSTIAVMFFFTFAIYIFHPDIINLKYDSLSNGMVLAQKVILVFSALLVFYSLNIILKVRSKDIGILMILGISKRQLKFILVLINIIMGFFSIVTGIIIGLVFTKFFLLLSEKIIATKTLCFYFPIKAIILTVVSFFILFFIISLLIPFLLSTKKINILLKEANMGDIEIKFSKVFSTLSIIMIIGGYFMAVFRKSDIVNDFLYAVSDVISIQIIFIFIIIAIGTLLFFSQFSMLAVQKLKKIRSFYMKKINILWISDLTYDMRNNARVLFLVTILLTLTFISLTFLYAMETIVKDETMKEYAVSFSHLSLPYNNKEKQHIKDIEDSLEKDEFEFEKHTSIILKQITDDKQQIHIINLSNYNEIATSLGMKNVYLKENEGYLVPSSYNYNVKRNAFLNSRTLSLNNKNIILYNVGVGEKNTHYAYKGSDWEKRAYIADYLYAIFSKQPYNSFHFFTSSNGLEGSKEFWKISLYLSLFIVVIFLLTAGSFLYLRLYSTLDQEKERYCNISKLGISLQEIKKVYTIQIAILFFIPYILASVHTYFFIKTLEVMFLKSFTSHLFEVLYGCFLFQFSYFFIIRSRYIKHLSRVIL